MLYREQPFVMSISADRLREEYAGDESVLVQGIIDAFFYEEEKLYWWITRQTGCGKETAVTWLKSIKSSLITIQKPGTDDGEEGV